jgi:hypothetical protein
MAKAGKERAQDFRREYYRREKQSGRPLNHTESDYFTDQLGCRIGVTWSQEGERGWFLNLMDGKFDAAVLLCQVRPDASAVIRLPKEFINKHWLAFSRDEKGEIKFNVVRERGCYCMRIGCGDADQCHAP